MLFAHHSAVKDPPFMRLDLVTCRNLLIYLERDLQRQLLALFHYALKPGGFLFLGLGRDASTPGPSSSPPSDREARLYAAKPAARQRDLELLTHCRASTVRTLLNAARPRAGAVPAAPAGRAPGGARGAGAAERRSSTRSTASSTSRTTPGGSSDPPEGPLSQVLPDLVRPELRAELRRALHRAFDARRGHA